MDSIKSMLEKCCKVARFMCIIEIITSEFDSTKAISLFIVLITDNNQMNIEYANIHA